VNKISAVHGFYEVTLVESGEKSEQVEKMFSDSRDEYAVLSVYMAFQSLRRPSFRARMHNFQKAKIEGHIKEVAKDKDRFKAEMESLGLAEIGEAEFETTRAMLSDIDHHFVIERKRGEEGRLISFMVEWAEDLCQIIFAKRWKLFESSGSGPFLTSDNPLTVMDPAWLPPSQRRGFITGVVVLPVSPARSLVLEPGRRVLDLEVVSALGSDVRQINGSTMLGAHREVYSNINSKRIAKAFGRTVDGASEELISEPDIHEFATQNERVRDRPDIISHRAKDPGNLS
jgi:hypothetical protein